VRKYLRRFGIRDPRGNVSQFWLRAGLAIAADYLGETAASIAAHAMQEAHLVASAARVAELRAKARVLRDVAAALETMAGMDG
jgi:hypothetical protein